MPDRCWYLVLSNPHPPRYTLPPLLLRQAGPHQPDELYGTSFGVRSPGKMTHTSEKLKLIFLTPTVPPFFCPNPRVACAIVALNSNPKG